MEKGQASIEVVFVAVIVIALSAIVLGSFVGVQNSVLINASAREAVLAVLSQKGGSETLQKIESANCETHIVVVAFMEPEPPSSRIDDYIDAIEAIQLEPPIEAYINNPLPLLCT
ncbi:MAG: hypothetical protein NUV67_03945 [archaeon]|nr:hypothetical protein [archaeon]